MLKYETIKNMETEYHKKYPNSIPLVLIGNFYHVYGKDTYIMCYIFKYKIINSLYKIIGNDIVNVPNTGFPCNSLNKVLLDLEDKKINYVIKAKDKNDIFKDFKKLNTYNKRYEVARRYCMDKIRVNEITGILDNMCGKRDFSNILDKIQNHIENYKE